MMRSKRFEPIQEIVANGATDLSRAMADAARRVADLERQLTQLVAYRENYARDASGRAGVVDVVRLQNYRSFIDRLNAAIEQQTRYLDAAREDYERRRAAWSEKRIEAESMAKVVDRFRHEERRAAERREQHDGDDAALRIALASAGALTGN